MTRSLKIALLAACAAAIGAGAIWGVFWSSRSENLLRIAGFVYPQPKPISPFQLTDHHGASFDLGTLKGKWSFVFFGFTHCPDVCPTTLVELNRAQRLLDETGLDAGIQYFFVSVDPGRDTPERLGRYVVHFNEKFVGATGTEQALKRFAHDVGEVYGFPDGTDGRDYSVAHSSTLALFDPDARLHAVFTPPQRAEALVDGFLRIQQRRAGSPSPPH